VLRAIASSRVGQADNPKRSTAPGPEGFEWRMAELAARNVRNLGSAMVDRTSLESGRTFRHVGISTTRKVLDQATAPSAAARPLDLNAQF